MLPCKPILIVEDDRAIRSALQDFFSGEDYTVYLAEHGQAAINLLALESTVIPGLILVDLMMPVMDGITFLTELQKKHPLIYEKSAIFVMTARTDVHKLNLKAISVIKKPFELDELSRIALKYCQEN